AGRRPGRPPDRSLAGFRPPATGKRRRCAERCGSCAVTYVAERALPGLGPDAAALLRGFARLAMPVEPGVGRAGEGNVAADEPLAHAFVKPSGPEPLELVVEVDHERRAGNPPRRTRGVGMQADHEKGFAAEAQR